MHLSAFGVLIIVLSNYIIFDIRHNFLLLKGILHNASPTAGNAHITLLDLLLDHLRFFTNLQLLINDIPLIVSFISLSSGFFFIMQLKDKKYRRTYLSALYFYTGFVLITFASRNIVTTGQSLPMIPLIYLIFSSFITSRYNKLFIIIFAAIYILNLNSAFAFIKNADNFIGKNVESWQFLLNLSKTAYSQNQTSFGYFVYSPDAYGYQPKYAMFYGNTLYPGRASYLQKKETTYVIAAPPPPNNPYMQDKWWIENELHIKKDPHSVITFPNGYKIEKYLLGKSEIKVPYDPNIDVGIFFR